MNYKQLKEGNVVSYITHFKDIRGKIFVKPVTCVVINIKKEDVDNKRFFAEGLHLMRSYSFYPKEKTFTDKKHYAVCEGHVKSFKNTPFTLIVEDVFTLTAKQVSELIT